MCERNCMLSILVCVSVVTLRIKLIEVIRFSLKE